MVERAYNRVMAQPRDELEKAVAQHRGIQEALRHWARTRQNPKAPRAELVAAEQALLQAIAARYGSPT